MNIKAIHETWLGTAINVLKAGVDQADKVSSKKNKTDIDTAASIARATSGLTLVFPIVGAESLSISSLTMASKAIEKRSVSFLQIALASWQITNSKDALNHIKRFHTNLKLDKVTVDEFIGLMDSAVHEDASLCIPDPTLVRLVKEDARQNLNYYFEDTLSESSLNDYKIVNRCGFSGIVREAKEEKKDTDPNKERRDMKKDGHETIKSQLLSSDVKKANELVPTMMVVNWYSSDTDTIGVQSVVGVKSKIYPAGSNEIMNRLVTKNADGNLLLKLIKASTRETSFVKDLLFAIDDAKLDALTKSKRGSSTKIFRALERRSIKGRIRKLMKSTNDAKAITTLCISQEEVDQMRKYNNLDIENPGVLIPIMEKLNLLYFMIIDESSEIVKIFIDGDSEYEVLSFDSLERDTNDNSYKKVINLMTKISR